jgi:hypothetical protein
MVELQLTVSDLQALAASIQRRDRPTKELRDYRWLRTARTMVLGFVLLAALNRNSLELTGLAALVPMLAVSALLGVGMWLLAGRAFARRMLVRADLEARHRLAAGGDHRTVWLDDTGVGQQDAVTVEHAAWPAIAVEETGEHYLLHARGHFDVVIPRREPGTEAFVRAVRSHLS